MSWTYLTQQVRMSSFRERWEVETLRDDLGDYTPDFWHVFRPSVCLSLHLTRLLTFAFFRFSLSCRFTFLEEADERHEETQTHPPSLYENIDPGAPEDSDGPDAAAASAR